MVGVRLVVRRIFANNHCVLPLIFRLVELTKFQTYDFMKCVMCSKLRTSSYRLNFKNEIWVIIGNRVRVRLTPGPRRTATTMYWSSVVLEGGEAGPGRANRGPGAPSSALRPRFALPGTPFAPLKNRRDQYIVVAVLRGTVVIRP